MGNAIYRHLQRKGHHHFTLKTHAELDLLNQTAVQNFFAAEKPEIVFMAAARVGGIVANRDHPNEFLYENSMIGLNILKAAANTKVKKLLNLASSCIYPKFAPQPISESALLTGSLEVTNEAYALAKITTLKFAEYLNRTGGHRFITAMPPNIFGPGDNFHPDYSHVIPGMIKRFHDAKLAGTESVAVWGSGAPLREFLFVDDLADAICFLADHYEDAKFINVPAAIEISILDLARTIADVVGYSGRIRFDQAQPDGTPRKQMDSSRMNAMGWKPKTEFIDGLRQTYVWFQSSGASPQ